MDAISVPQGHVNLTDARHFYLERRFPNADTINEQQQKEADHELMAAFRAHQLNACIRHPESDTIDHLPDDWWDREEWADMIFLSPTVRSLSAWQPYNGMVPFVRRDELEKWVHAQTQPAPPSIPTGFDGILLDGHDPMTMPSWSLGMAIIWIMCRSPEDAAVYWRDTLDAAVFEFHVGEPTRRNITFETARNDLISKLASNDLRATVIDTSGESKKLKAHEWLHLKLHTDTDKDGLHFYLWKPGGIGGTYYHNIRLTRADVLAAWPEAGSNKTTSMVMTDASAAQSKSIGRRLRYDWEAFNRAAILKLEEEGSFDPSVDIHWNKAALERYMATWCQTNWNKVPGESTIRSKLSEIESAYLEGRKGR
jgi:hypothetical protein